MVISSPLKLKVTPVTTTPDKTVKKFQSILFNRTRVKKEIFQRKTILQNRRIENERRKQLEDELEAPNLVIKPRGPSQLIAGSAKGFFDRLIGFLGYLTAGWIINNLPTWISMGKEFIARTQQMGKILGNFIVNSTDIFKNFTRLLGATLTNLMEFDFLDTSGRVSTAFDELNLSVENWGTGFEDVIKLITTPLTEGIASGEDAPSTGTENTNEGAYERTAPYSGTPAPQIDKNLKFNKGQNIKGKIGQSNIDYVEVTSLRGNREGGWHGGMDIGAPTGTYIALRVDCEVVATANQSGGYGLVIDVWVPQYGVQLRFAHNSSIIIKSGKIPAGTSFARVGSTGKSTGPHIHLEADTRKGSASYGGSMDPSRFVPLISLTKSPGKPTPAPSTPNQPQQNLMGTPLSSSSGGGDVGPWGPLLKVIAGGESGRGGYEAMYPSTTLPGATKMTIADVARKSTGAVGKYQQLPQHLVGRAKNAKLDPNKDLYSPANQDVIAAKVNIGMNRGGNDWLAGKFRTEQFGKELSKEFAALKQPNGVGYHDGDGRNKATVEWKTVEGALNQIKKGGGSQTSSPSPAQTPQSKPPSPAQIAPTGTPQNPQIPQSLAQERIGPTVIVSQNPSSPARQMMYSGGGGSSGGGSSPISDFALLNNFIKNKLLLDLAYL